MKLTDKNAIRVALVTAIDTEESLVEAYRFNGKVEETEPGVIVARRRIEAYKRILKKYYGITDLKSDLDTKTTSISIYDLMRGKVD